MKRFPEMLHLTKLQPNFASNVQMTSLKGCDRTAEDKKEEQRGERAGTSSEARGTGGSRSSIVLLKKCFLEERKKNATAAARDFQTLKACGVPGCLFGKSRWLLPQRGVFYGNSQWKFQEISMNISNRLFFWKFPK